MNEYGKEFMKNGQYTTYIRAGENSEIILTIANNIFGDVETFTFKSNSEAAQFLLQPNNKKYL